MPCNFVDKTNSRAQCSVQPTDAGFDDGIVLPNDPIVKEKCDKTKVREAGVFLQHHHALEAMNLQHPNLPLDKVQCLHKKIFIYLYKNIYIFICIYIYLYIDKYIHIYVHLCMCLQIFKHIKVCNVVYSGGGHLC